jgi:hypothetical protein
MHGCTTPPGVGCLVGRLGFRCENPFTAASHWWLATAGRHCHLGLGKLYGKTGKRRQAREHVTTETAMYREMDMPFWLEQAATESHAPG